MYRPKMAVASVGSNAILRTCSRYRVVTAVNRDRVGQQVDVGKSGVKTWPTTPLPLCPLIYLQLFP
jgi:hypothetical protein